MIMGQSYKAPPALSKCSSYDLWFKKIEIWKHFTDVPEAKQASAIFLTLEGKAREAVLELDVAILASDNGVKHLTDRLDKLYSKDKAQLAYEAYDSFERFKREDAMSMTDFINEFERLHNKAKAYDCQVSDTVLAYRVLKSANLSREHEQLARATIGELSYSNMTTQLKKIFGDSPNFGFPDSLSTVKVEPIYEVSGDHGDFPEDGSYSEASEPIYYGDNYRWSRGGATNRYQSRRVSGRFRPKQFGSSRNSPRVGKNPLDSQGNVSRCAVCGSINHWASACPDAQSHDVQITLFQTGLEESESYQCFVAESFSSAILDSGANKTVCGSAWLRCYLDSLDASDKDLVTFHTANSTFRFGDGRSVVASEAVMIPAQVGTHRVFIAADVVDNDIPLLLSRPAMQRANTEINFKDDTVSMLGVTQKLHITSSGHYAIPLSKRAGALLDESSLPSITLTSSAMSSELENKHSMAVKLHKQFSHPTSDRLIHLLRKAGYDDDDLYKEVIGVTKDCQICKVYRKPSARPVVGMPLATQFNECVAMDLKQFAPGIWFLHLIDHATRFSASAVVTSKKREDILRGIFRIWITIFGPPSRFLSDNGGEFNNADFLEMCESLNIVVKTTAAESPWSNGLCERHNGILGEAVQRTISEVRCSVDIALAWAVHAKNALHNVHGFSPYQLVFGQNPQLPNFYINKPPALNKPSVEFIASHLAALHGARHAFLQAESSEKIKRALRHNLRSYQNVSYCSGDRVYYKRNDSNEWKGPATVLGRDGQCVLIRHGGFYVRVHPCRLMITNDKDTVEG